VRRVDAARAVGTGVGDGSRGRERGETGVGGAEDDVPERDELDGGDGDGGGVRRKRVGAERVRVRGAEELRDAVEGSVGGDHG